MFQQQIRQHLFDLQDLQYQKFVAKLIPTEDKIIGVRKPLLDRFAKQLVTQHSQTNLLSYIKTSLIYHEEILLQGILINLICKDLKSLQHYTELFIPKIRNWAICDCFCSHLKLSKQHLQSQWQFIQPYFLSSNTYTIRFACVMGLTYFIQDEYIELLLKQLDQIPTIQQQDYYVKMAIAWALSICFIKYPNKTLNYLTSDNNLDNFTHNKSCQKILESSQISPNVKTDIRKLKKK